MLQERIASGVLTTPLSAEHYAEIEARIKDVRQRNDIALTMAELSAFQTLVSRGRRLRYKFRKALATVVGLNAPKTNEPAPVAYGAGHAFGHPFRGVLRGPGAEMFDPGERVYAALDHLEEAIGGGWRFSRRRQISNRRELLIAAFTEPSEYALLRGPYPSQVKALRGYGYRPEEATLMMASIAQREGRIKEQLNRDPALMRRIDDVVAVSTIIYDLPDILPEVLSDLGLAPDAFTKLGKPGMTAVLMDTPILRVEMALRRGLFKNGDYVVKVNDTYDLAALGVAVVCCDIVVTDRSAAHRLKVAGMDRRYSCRVLATPEYLVTHA